MRAVPAGRPYQLLHVFREVREHLRPLAFRDAVDEAAQHRVSSEARLTRTGTGRGFQHGLERERRRRWRRAPERRTSVAADETGVEMRLDAFDPHDVQNRMLDHISFVRAPDVAVQERDVIRHHHVYVRHIELLHDRPERRADPIGENVVGHVRVRLPSGQAVEDAGRGRDRVAHVAGQPFRELPDGPPSGRVWRGDRGRTDDAGHHRASLNESFRHAT